MLSVRCIRFYVLNCYDFSRPSVLLRSTPSQAHDPISLANFPTIALPFHLT